MQALLISSRPSRESAKSSAFSALHSLPPNNESRSTHTNASNLMKPSKAEQGVCLLITLFFDSTKEGVAQPQPQCNTPYSSLNRNATRPDNSLNRNATRLTAASYLQLRTKHSFDELRDQLGMPFPSTLLATLKPLRRAPKKQRSRCMASVGAQLSKFIFSRIKEGEGGGG